MIDQGHVTHPRATQLNGPQQWIKARERKEAELVLCYSHPQNHVRKEQTILPIEHLCVSVCV